MKRETHVHTHGPREGRAGGPLRLIGCAAALVVAMAGCAQTSSSPSVPTTPATTVATSAGAAPTTGGSTEDQGTGVWIDLPAGAAVDQTGGGYTDDGLRWFEGSAYDDAVVVGIFQASTKTTNSDADVEQQVTEALTDVQSASWHIASDSAASATYSYPARSFEFYAGSGSEVRSVVGLYFETDTGGIAIMAGFADDATEEQKTTVTDDWFQNLSFVDA